MRGIVNEDFIDLTQETASNLEAVADTPAAALGSTRDKPDGTHSNNPTVRAAKGKGVREALAWAYERPGGGRGFGCTGSHFHGNWADDDYRRMILNALVWTSGLEVPAEGVASKPTAEDLVADQDLK